MEKSILYVKISVSLKKNFFSKFRFKYYIGLSFSYLQYCHKYSLTYNVSTSSHCAQKLVTISKVVLVKSVMKTVVVMMIRIEPY